MSAHAWPTIYAMLVRGVYAGKFVPPAIPDATSASAICALARVVCGWKLDGGRGRTITKDEVASMYTNEVFLL